MEIYIPSIKQVSYLQCFSHFHITQCNAVHYHIKIKFKGYKYQDHMMCGYYQFNHIDRKVKLHSDKHIKTYKLKLIFHYLLRVLNHNI